MDNLEADVEGTITDIFGEQIEIESKWFHAERIFGKPATDFCIGDRIPNFNSTVKKTRAPIPDEIVSSDLFRESGANISHYEDKIAQYASAMLEYNGWGNFPPIAARVITITADDFETYLEFEKAGYASELAYSRPLTNDDIGKRIAHIENGHNRAYAAARCQIPIPVFDLLLQDKENEVSCEVKASSLPRRKARI